MNRIFIILFLTFNVSCNFSKFERNKNLLIRIEDPHKECFLNVDKHTLFSKVPKKIKSKSVKEEVWLRYRSLYDVENECTGVFYYRLYSNYRLNPKGYNRASCFLLDKGEVISLWDKASKKRVKICEKFQKDNEIELDTIVQEAIIDGYVLVD